MDNDISLQTIRCEFKRKLFASDDKSFCVMLYNDTEKAECFTAVGADLPSKEKVKIDLTGKWEKRNGSLQLKVESWCYPRLNDKKGFVSYIESLKCGVGARKAGKVYDYFGAAVWDVISNTPERLNEVRGLNQRNIDKMITRIRETESQQRIMEYFSKANARIAPKQAAEYCNKYGANAIATFEHNPYGMLAVVSGVGFDNVDAVALAMGKPTDNPERVRAYAYRAIADYSAQTGSVCVPADTLVEKICKTIGVSRDTVIGILKEEWVSTRLMASNKCFYTKKSFDEECIIAENLVRFNKRGVKCTKNIDSYIDAYEAKNKITLAEQQREAVKAVFSDAVSVVTGGPGTGKTTVIKAILYVHKEIYGDKSEPVLLAPTGKASKRMSEATGYSATTIHSAVGYLGDGMENDCEIEGNLIIVDESSMMDQEICYMLLEKIQPGSQIVFVGDIDQLPSVGAGNVLSDIIASRCIKVTRLSVIYRQEGTNPIIANCQTVNNGSSELLYTGSFKFFNTKGDTELLFNAVVNFYCKCVDRYGVEDVCLLNPRRQNTRVSVQNLNAAIQERLNPSVGGMEIKVGTSVFRSKDRVMQTKNAEVIKNGDTGTIKEITTEERDDETVVIAVIDFGDGNIMRYDKEQIMNFGVELAYCTTVHKSQGMEYGTVIIVLTTEHYNLLRKKIVYTAISRAKKNVAIFGEPKALNVAVNNTRETRRETLLAERIAYYSKA